MTERQMRAFRQFVAAGYSKEGAAALVGNASQESGPNLTSGYRERTDHGSQGIFQWRLDRLSGPNGLIAYCKERQLHSGTLAAQVEFAIYELGRDYPRLDGELRKGGDVSALTSAVCWEYERPSKQYANLANRIRQAKTVLNAAKIETNAGGGAMVSAGSLAGGLIALLQTGLSPLGITLLIISGVVGLVMAGAMRRETPKPPKGEEMPIPNILASPSLEFALKAALEERAWIDARILEIVKSIKDERDALDGLLSLIPTPAKG